jgi:cysteinyl-tRNA synthetase
MGLRLFNTLSRAVEDFVPLDPAGKQVGMYCCGPTVYDYGHIGNFRTFVFADLVRRFLEFKGYAVRQVMNITDVEDKIIRRLREARESLAVYTRKYEAAFLQDLLALTCLRPHLMPRATEHIQDIIQLIERLMAQGMAYQATDGSVYFSIGNYRQAGRQYGQLLRLNFEEMRPGERVRHDEYSKESVADFALWKAHSPEDGGVFWPSPWGEGRPGWHIECSAMSMKELGPSFDLHLGGEDLIFPHHEDEIAQSEGAGLQVGGRRFVHCWLHGAHLLVEGKKMSKSLGNFFTLRDLLSKGYQGREIRYLLLKAHYRETLNFTLDGLEEARSALGRLDECLAKLREIAGTPGATPNAAFVDRFAAALDEDLNISAGWACVFDWVREINRLVHDNRLSPESAAANWAAWERINQVVGLEQKPTQEQAPKEVLNMVEARQKARQAKDFHQADTLRHALTKLGWLVEDTPKGPKLKRISL